MCSKFIIICNTNGELEEVLLDELGCFQKLDTNTSFQELVCGEYTEIFKLFIEKVVENRKEERATLAINLDGIEEVISLSGYLLGDTILFSGITVSSNGSETEKTQKEQTTPKANSIDRSKDQIEPIYPSLYQKDINDEILEDFTKLNSILANNQRELFKKNMEIESLNKALKEEKENIEMFAYSISHDLKEPIRMVKSFMFLFNKKYGHQLDEKASKYVSYAIDGAIRMETMIYDLLYYYKATNIENNEDVDLNKILSIVKNNLADSIQKSNTKIESDDLPKVKGAAIAFHQVFQNLISNAIKFVPGNVEPSIRINISDKIKFWELEISDNGKGIPKEKLTNVFNLFQKDETKDTNESSGIGLAIVKKIIEKGGGEIWVKSEVGKGTSFFFTIPK